MPFVCDFEACFCCWNANCEIRFKCATAVRKKYLIPAHRGPHQSHFFKSVPREFSRADCFVSSNLQSFDACTEAAGRLKVDGFSMSALWEGSISASLCASSLWSLSRSSQLLSGPDWALRSSTNSLCIILLQYWDCMIIHDSWSFTALVWTTWQQLVLVEAPTMDHFWVYFLLTVQDFQPLSVGSKHRAACAVFTFLKKKKNE